MNHDLLMKMQLAGRGPFERHRGWEPKVYSLGKGGLGCRSRMPHIKICRPQVRGLRVPGGETPAAERRPFPTFSAMGAGPVTDR